MQTIRLNEIEVCKSYERYTPNINITILKTLRYTYLGYIKKLHKKQPNHSTSKYYVWFFKNTLWPKQHQITMAFTKKNRNDLNISAT